RVTSTIGVPARAPARPGAVAARSRRRAPDARRHPERGPRPTIHTEGTSMSDLFSIAGKTALVTGGGQGIGLMISRGFIEAGVKVYISSRKTDVIDAAAADLSALPGSRGCIAVQADLADADEAQRLADEISEREDGRLDILVNNAG